MDAKDLSPAINKFCGSFPVVFEKEVTVAEAEKYMTEQLELAKKSK